VTLYDNNRPSDIRFAKGKGVKLTTFDSTNEVNKLAQYYHSVSCWYRYTTATLYHCTIQCSVSQYVTLKCSKVLCRID
jgi:diaminopimelate decarboxylase